MLILLGEVSKREKRKAKEDRKIQIAVGTRFANSENMFFSIKNRMFDGVLKARKEYVDFDPVERN